MNEDTARLLYAGIVGFAIGVLVLAIALDFAGTFSCEGWMPMAEQSHE